MLSLIHILHNEDATLSTDRTAFLAANIPVSLDPAADPLWAVSYTHLDVYKRQYFEKWSSGDYTGLIASWSPSNALTYVQRYVTDRRVQYAGSYNNPEMNKLILDAQSTLDDDARMEKIENIVSIVNQDSPQISLFQSVWLRAHDAKLQGVVLSGTGYTDYNMMYWAE